MSTAIIAILMFFILISIHELGHFVAAKSVGIKVDEFALGMGPAILKKKKGETEYSLRVFPIGGYCKMEGEDVESDSERAFVNKKKWQRTVVLVAGATMNILLGFLLSVVINFMVGDIRVPVVKSVLPESNVVGVLQVGDRITKVNGTRVHIQNDILFELSRTGENPLEVEVLRNGTKKKLSITPTISEDRKIIGFAADTEKLTFTKAISKAYYDTVFMGKVVLVSLGDLVTGKIGFKEVSGPLGIISTINSTVEETTADAFAKTINVLGLVAFITINLGVFNLLPLPALDGGRILFVIIEFIRGKKIDAEKEGFVHFIGFALLIILMLVVTSSDIIKLVKGLFV